jgi:predicted phosphodiesterase
MSKILFSGDVHGIFDHIIQAVSHHRPDAIILLGDIEARRPLHIELASIIDVHER